MDNSICNIKVYTHKLYKRCPELNINVKIDDKPIEQVNTSKFLGFLIDNKLNWHAHTTHVFNIISKYNGIIRKISQFLPPHSLSTLDNTLVYPYLLFRAIIWADPNNSHRNSIFLYKTILFEPVLTLTGEPISIHYFCL